MGANLGEGPANVTAISALYLIIKVFFNCDQCVFYIFSFAVDFTGVTKRSHATKERKSSRRHLQYGYHYTGNPLQMRTLRSSGRNAYGSQR